MRFNRKICILIEIISAWKLISMVFIVIHSSILIMDSFSSVFPIAIIVFSHSISFLLSLMVIGLIIMSCVFLVPVGILPVLLSSWIFPFLKSSELLFLFEIILIKPLVFSVFFYKGLWFECNIGFKLHKMISHTLYIEHINVPCFK